MGRKIAIVFVVLLVIYGIAGFFVLPAYVRPLLEEKLSAALGRDVAIDSIKINPFVLSVTIKGFSIKDRKNRALFVSFDELFVNVQARSVIKRGLIVQEVRLKKPVVKIARIDAKTYNFSDLLKKRSGAPQKKPAKPFLFSIGNIAIVNGTIDFQDQVANAHHQATDINFTIPFISNIDEYLDVFVQPKFSARMNGTLFTLAGQSKPFKDSLETSLSLDLKGISLPFYMGYLPADLDLKIASGILDLKTRLSYIQHRGKKPSLSLTGDLFMHNLSVLDAAHQPILVLPETHVALGPSQLLEKKISLTAIELSSPGIFIQKAKNGKLNLAGINSKNKQAPGEEKKKNGEMTFAVKGFSITKGSVLFTDMSRESPVKLALEGIDIKAKDISTQRGAKGSISLSSRLNRSCTISALSTLTLKPLACDTRMDIQGLEPVWVQAYFTDTLRIMITRGNVLTQGMLHVEKKDASKPKVSFDGNIVLSDFASADKKSADDFVKCKTLSLEKMKAGINPGYIDIGTVRLKDLSSRILVSPDGKVNLAMVVKKKPAPASKSASVNTPQKKNSDFERIAINQVVLDNARINFIDKSVKGGYSADLARLKGTIRGLSSNKATRADVNIAGMLNRNAPVLIKGRINPFKESLFIDLHTSLNDLDLSPMSPYSGKYAGYEIEKGKLNLDLTYLIRNKDLDSQNNVLIDQFTFGDSVDSPTATKLPVRFAVALLRDAGGKIDIKLPVKGRTDDPKFSVWGIIVQMIKNLIVKAATSPFALLESMYPGASQLSTVEFAYGRSDLPDSQESRFATLAKILSDKPALNLELRGFADPQEDRQGLVSYMFEKKLKAQKVRDTVKRGDESSSLRSVVIKPEEYQLYLKKAYAAEEFPKPKNAVGLPAALPPEEMEKLIRQHIEVKEADLRLLAMNRAQKVQEYLVGTSKIAPSRIFLIETKALSPEQRQGTKNSRVEVSLK